MTTTARTLSFAILFSATIIHAAMVRVENSLNLDMNGGFLSSTLLGYRELPIDATSDIYAIVNTSTGIVEESSLSWSYDLATNNMSKSQFSVTETIHIDTFTFDGVFDLQGKPNLINGMYNFPLSDETSEFVLEGTYTITGRNQTVSVPFFYSITRTPTSTLGFIDLNSDRIVARGVSYRLEPSVGTLFDGSIDGVRVRSLLLPINAPISVPEPSTPFMWIIALFLGFIRKYSK